MVSLSRLERIILGGKEPLQDPITNAKIALPSAIAVGINVGISALVSIYTLNYTESKGANTLISHAVEFFVYPPTFILAYMTTNRKRYTIEGKYNYRYALYDLFAKIIPSAGPSSFLVDGGRDIVNYSIMSLTGLHPAISTGITQISLAIPHYLSRKAILASGSYLRKNGISRIISYFKKDINN